MRLIDADRFEVEEGDEVVITFRFPDGQEVTAVMAPGLIMELVSERSRAAAVEVPEQIRQMFGGNDGTSHVRRR